MIQYVDKSYVISTDADYDYINDLNGTIKKGRYIIGMDCCEKFI
jgi:hypothetical protein